MRKWHSDTFKPACVCVCVLAPGPRLFVYSICDNMYLSIIIMIISATAAPNILRETDRAHHLCLSPPPRPLRATYERAATI